MNTRKLPVLIAACAIGLVAMLAIAAQPVSRQTVFSSLKVGQPVNLKERAGLYEVSTMDDMILLTHKVVEIGDNYLVLQDYADVTVSHIPVTAVRAVIHIKTK